MARKILVLLAHPTLICAAFMIAWAPLARDPSTRTNGHSQLRIRSASPRQDGLICMRLKPIERKHADAQSNENPCKPHTWPCGDVLDQRIFALALPAILNFLILPLTGTIDLFFIGRLGSALATAGQAAANQVYSTAALLTSVVPVVTVPLIAKAHAAGDQQEVQRQVGGALFISFILGMLVTLLVSLGSSHWLLALTSAAVLPHSVPYLLYRLPGVVPDALSTVGFSSCRGTMDSVTPLKISFLACLVNAAFNPILMFMAGLGIAGAGAATALSQIVACVAYLTLFFRRKIIRWSTLLEPPSTDMLKQLVAAGGAVQTRNVALNVAFVAITRTTQALDTSGIAAAAHSITIALWQIGGVVLFAMGSATTILASAELGREGSTPEEARAIAQRLLAWGVLLGGALGVFQIAALPLLRGFTPLPEVRKAAYIPSIIGAMLQLMNALVFIGEGLMVATGAFGELAMGQVVATAAFILALKLAPPSLISVWLCFWVFNGARLANFIKYFWFSESPLRPRASTDRTMRQRREV